MSCCAFRCETTICGLRFATMAGGIAPDRQSWLGIGSMQARASQLGGVLQIEASGEEGTQVILHFPLIK
jgi:glucose-6-phosphate-specific signal transduction histidine kinase